MSIITYREAINQALREEMERDNSIILIGEDIGLFGGAMAVTKGLYEKFGEERVIDTPISESVIIGGALGMALTGLRPIAEIMFIDFTLVCMDQIINQVAKVRYMLGGQVKIPLVIRTQGGGGKGYAAQHSQSLEVMFAHMPGLKVVMPSNPEDSKGLLKSSIRDNNPVLFIEHKLLYNEKGEVPEEEYTIPIGKAKVAREGKDITIVAHSRMTLFALEAADSLAKEGISCEVIDLRTLRPLDTETIINSVKKTHRLITVEEGHLSFGIGAEISSRITELAFDELDAPPLRIGAMEASIPFNEGLEKEYLPSLTGIIKAVHDLIL